MKILKREEVEEKYKWDLSAIVKSDKIWQELFSKTAIDYKIIANFKGKLNNEKTVIDCLKLENTISESLERLYVYAKMKLDENSTITEYQDKVSKAEMLSVEISSLTSFVVPELTKLSTDELKKFAINNDEFSCFFEDLIRSKPYILSEAEERILSEVSSFSDLSHDTFNMFDNADIKFNKIRVDGKSVELSHGLYSLCMQNYDRKVRKDAFTSMFTAFKDMINTVAMLYNGNVKKDCFYAKVRGYDSAIQKAMFSENVTPEVYENLVNSVNDGLHLLHDYVLLRKKVLGFKKLHMYDMHVALVPGASLELEYEDSFKLVEEALAPLGNEYADLLKKAYNEKWIDVQENKGKRSGAYSWGVYGAHPYVLLNYQKTTHDVFTIAHELGHAMHSYYSNSTQPYEKAGYEIFVAEVASTVNEILVLKHLISKASGDVKKYLLSYYLDMFRTTLFRQTQFAQFEKEAHDLYEKGESLTPDALNNIYLNLNKIYYGKAVESDMLIKYEWARIPHFYNSFYVYKYATGITSAVHIANSILNGEPGALEKYKKFLSLGGSLPPVEILKVAGVDLTQKEPFKVAMREFQNTLSALKELLLND